MLLRVILVGGGAEDMELCWCRGECEMWLLGGIGLLFVVTKCYLHWRNFKYL